MLNNTLRFHLLTSEFDPEIFVVSKKGYTTEPSSLSDFPLNYFLICQRRHTFATFKICIFTCVTSVFFSCGKILQNCKNKKGPAKGFCNLGLLFFFICQISTIMPTRRPLKRWMAWIPRRPKAMATIL